MLKHPGLVRERLAALLLERGLSVSPYDLWTQEGAYRSQYWGLARWGSNDAKWLSGTDPDGKAWHMPVQLSSWSRMRDCVRFGIEIGNEERSGAWSHVGVEHAGISTESRRTVMPIGAPNSPARWLSENVQSIPAHHRFALMRMEQGRAVLITSGTKKHCSKALSDDSKECVCDLEKYRQAAIKPLT
jgi:hypothetical protein